MKKKVTMICILKSGAVVKDFVKFKKTATSEMEALTALIQDTGNSVGCIEPILENIQFGGTTIAISEIAAITFKGN